MTLDVMPDQLHPNLKGYQNLVKLSSLGFIEGYDQRTDGNAAGIATASSRTETTPKEITCMRFIVASPHSFRLNVTRSVPACVAIDNLNSHQPPMLKRTPSMT
mgnify:CR=1 FL=1